MPGTDRSGTFPRGVGILFLRGQLVDLADFQEISVGVTKEASDLTTAIQRGCEKLGATGTKTS